MGPGSLLRSRQRAQVSGDTRGAEIFLDGYYVGTVDDFDGMYASTVEVRRGDQTPLNVSLTREQLGSDPIDGPTQVSNNRGV